MAAVTGQHGPITFPLDPPGSLTRALALGGGVAWGATALSTQRRTRGACAGCGRRAGSDGGAIPSSVPVARWAAYLAGMLALGYGALKVQWGLGGDIGLSKPDALGDVHLWTPGLGDTACSRPWESCSRLLWYVPGGAAYHGGCRSRGPLSAARC